MAQRLIALLLLLACPLVGQADEEQKLEREKVIELLGNLLPQAVPTAQVQVVAGKGHTLILTGQVAHPEDVETITRIARAVWGPSAGEIINALKDSAPRIHLDLSMLRIDRSELGQADATALADSRALSAAECQQLHQILRTLVEEEQGSFWTETVLVTLSGRAAYHSTGGEGAVPTVAGFGGNSDYVPPGYIQRLPPHIRLHFVPTIQADGQIHVEFKPEGLRLAEPFTPVALTLAPGGGALLVVPNVTWNDLKEQAEDLIVLATVKSTADGKDLFAPPAAETRPADDFELIDDRFLDRLLDEQRNKEPACLKIPFVQVQLDVVVAEVERAALEQAEPELSCEYQACQSAMSLGGAVRTQHASAAEDRAWRELLQRVSAAGHAALREPRLVTLSGRPAYYVNDPIQVRLLRGARGWPNLPGRGAGVHCAQSRQRRGGGWRVRARPLRHLGSRYELPGVGRSRRDALSPTIGPGPRPGRPRQDLARFGTRRQAAFAATARTLARADDGQIDALLKLGTGTKSPGTYTTHDLTAPSFDRQRRQAIAAGLPGKPLAQLPAARQRARRDGGIRSGR
jgi:hypothetical protein